MPVLLIELLTEELPPKALRELSDSFASKLFFDLQKANFLADKATVSPFASPRRLAAVISSVAERSPDSEREVQGPSTSAPQQAVAGFAKKNGVAVEALKKQQTAKGEVYVARSKTPGRALAEVLPEFVASAVKALPVPKIMRWGAGDAQFVRPVHGLVMLHGSKVVAGKVLGLESGRSTSGHRFLGKGEISLAEAGEYETKLRDQGMVIADFAQRRSEIEKQLQAEVKRQNASLGEYKALLDEVTALVEFPSVYVGTFDKAYLEVPQECLILTMRQNQKYFPLFDAAGKLLPKFLIVSNMQVADPRHIVSGNERVVRPRLEDARFFYNQDRKVRLETRVPQLAKVVYHNKLGSQLERVQRVQLLAGSIARQLKADAAAAERAAGSPKPICSPAWSASFPSCRASWAATTRCTTASLPRSPTPSTRTTARASPAIGCRKETSRAPWRSPTSSTRWRGSSVLASSPPARRIPSACAAPPLE